MVELSPDAVLVHTDYKFVYVNPAAQELFGAVDENEMVGKPVFEFVHSEDREAIKERIYESYSQKRITSVKEIKILRVDGHVVNVESTGAPITYQGKAAMQVVIRDITERKQAEAKLLKEHREIALANRLLEVFVKETGDDVYDKALDIMLEGMESRHGVFGYIDEQGVLVCPTPSKIYDQCEMEGKCIYYTRDKWKGLWSHALLEKRTLYSNKPARVPDGHVPIRNNMATPILFHGNAIGLITLANKETDFTEEDRECLETISNTIAPVLFAWIKKSCGRRSESRRRKSLSG